MLRKQLLSKYKAEYKKSSEGTRSQALARIQTDVNLSQEASLSQADAEDIFNSIYKEVYEGREGNCWGRSQEYKNLIKYMISFYQQLFSLGHPH